MSDIKISALADLHIGNARIDNASMYANLVKYFYPEVMTSHICFIAGDFFDTLQYLGSASASIAIRITKDLLGISEKYGVQIRIVQGTFSHDRNQITTFVAMTRDALMNDHATTEELPTVGRLKVITKIEVEEIGDLVANNVSIPDKLKVVYLPDSLPYKHGIDVVNRIRDLYTLCGWSSSDMVVGHGTFDFMMPDNVPLPPCTYDIPMFEGITDGPIVMGHIHTHARRKNVVYTGSFERIAHGEEEDKGFIVLHRNDGRWTSRFIRNDRAVPFITVYPEGSHHDGIIADYLRKVLDKFGQSPNGYVRVMHHDAEVRNILGRVTSSKFPSLHYVSKTTAVEDKLQLKTTVKTTADDGMVKGGYEGIIPTEHNLDELIIQFLKDRPHLSSDIDDLTQEDVSRLLRGE